MHEEIKNNSMIDTIEMHNLKCENDTVPGQKKINTDENETLSVNEYYYDFLSKESYIQMVKECVEFERQSDNMGLDSAILIYSDDLIPIDSIIKWWKNTP